MSLEAPTGGPNPGNQCRYCGAYVSSRFCRVYGDNDDEAHRCPECDSWTRIQSGSAAGRSVAYQERPGGNGRDRGRSDQAYATGGESDGV